MLWLLICAGALVGGNRIAPQDSSYMEREDVTVTTKPHIYYCRSPNMEDFTCWWRPLDNATDSHVDVTYVLTYYIKHDFTNKEPTHECPDYVTGGPHSCHFDKRHTSVWMPYCMTVTAVTPLWNYTYHEYCVDVADIVQMEAPVNLTYNLSEAGGDEVGHNTLLSWAYPVPSTLQYGWITLVYELQYRHVAEPDNWKVKERLRDSHIELLGLPEGDYVVRVRCQSSHNSKLWSTWSSTLIMTIPARPPAGKMLVLILMTSFGMVVLLAIGFGIIPQSKRIRAYFLPPIPKPHIIGIDPLLLKMGHIEEINRHFSSFHGYRPPSYAEEVWDRVSADDDDDFPPPALPEEEEELQPPPPSSNHHHHHLLLQKFTSSGVAPSPPQSPQEDATAAALLLLDPFYVQSPSSRCRRPPAPDDVVTPSHSPACPWPPGIVFLPGGGDYSVMGPPPGVAPTPAAPRSSSQPDFYTCVQIMNETGEVLLVPCLNPAAATAGGGGGEEVVAAAPWCPPPPTERGGGGDEEEEEEGKKKKKQLAERQARKTAPAPSERKGDVAVGNVG